MKSRLVVLFNYILEVFNTSPLRFVVSIVLAILLGFFQGLSLMSLLPLLGQVNIIPSDDKSDVARFFKPYMDSVGWEPDLFSTLSVFFLVNLAFFLLRWLKERVDIVLTEQYGANLREALVASFLFMEWQKKNEYDLGVLQNAVITASARISFGAVQWTKLISSACISLLLIFFYLWVSWEAALCVSLVFLPFSLLQYYVNKRSGRLGKELHAQNESHMDEVIRLTEGLKDVQASRKTANFLAKYRLTSTNLKASSRVYANLRSSAALVYQLVGVFGLSLLIFASVRWVHLEVSELILIIVIMARLLPNMLSLLREIQFIMSSLPSFESCYELIKKGSENHDNKRGNQQPAFKNTIELQNITFGYEPDRIILSDFSASISFNSRTCLFGFSGAGKSSLIDLITGFNTFKQGEIFIDGTPISEINLKLWRASFAYVTQIPHFFSGSLRQNLFWFDDTNRQDLQRSKLLELLKLKDVIREQGLDTPLVDDAGRMSGGERQRLAILRALLQQPQILVLDEATSEVDSETEEAIFDYLSTLDLTLIFITHNEKLLKYADKVINVG